MQNIEQIDVFIPFQDEFRVYEEELRELYNKNKYFIKDTNAFDFIKDNTLFYSFVNKKKLIGAIYFFKEKDKLFLNAFSKRKTFNLNIKCLKMSLNWFNCPIYAEAQNRASALCLLRCGFRRIENKLFVYN